MLDLILRALRHPFDYFGVLQKRTLLFQEIIRESDTIYSFIFKMEKPFSWKAGQHGIFYFPNTKIDGKKWRAFSIASSAEESVIKVSTVIKQNPSDFKKHFLELERGDSILMRGPFGEFHTTSKTKHIIGIAGGIGITPFRALIKEIVSDKIADTKLTLIYSAVGAYTFRKEFDALLPHPQIEIIYTTTPDEVNAKLDLLLAADSKDAHYFISGSPGMITAIQTKLKNKGVTHIISDSFKGY